MSCDIKILFLSFSNNNRVRSQFKPLGNEGGTPLTDILKRMKNLNELRYALLKHKVFYINQIFCKSLPLLYICSSMQAVW